jgi:hypothetical protein
MGTGYAFPAAFLAFAISRDRFSKASGGASSKEIKKHESKIEQVVFDLYDISREGSRQPRNP